MRNLRQCVRCEFFLYLMFAFASLNNLLRHVDLSNHQELRREIIMTWLNEILMSRVSVAEKKLREIFLNDFDKWLC